GILYRASTEVYAIDIESGEELWSTRLRSGLFGRDNAIVAGDILFELASEGTVVALEAATGSPLFEVAVDTAEFASLDPAAVGDGYLLVLDEQRRIHAFA
ncbi:MAG: PQQ-binding-like beta-propeller repeat protein, partial [Acidimicrobiales bacterium]